jgi:hypothetical protein
MIFSCETPPLYNPTLCNFTTFIYRLYNHILVADDSISYAIIEIAKIANEMDAKRSIFHICRGRRGRDEGEEGV